ncbi:hypothetical protein Avbf_06808 [Armadillidium vulgare]|nr:hypothetical protein Avbf_06808 [Armadillidium vulgare]
MKYIFKVLSVTLDLQFSLHDGDKSCNTWQTNHEGNTVFEILKLPTFSHKLCSVLTTTISDRRRKRRERLRRSKNRSLNDWKISDLLHALKETFSLRRDLAINEDEDNHPEYQHHPQALCARSQIDHEEYLRYVRVLESSL